MERQLKGNLYCEALHIPIPLKSSDQLKEPLTRADSLKYLMIREFKFNERDWTNIIQGLLGRKSCYLDTFQLHLYRSKITKKNLPFLEELIKKFKLQQLHIILLHTTFENQSIFDKLLDLAKKHTQLASFIVSKDSLTDNQLEILMNVQKDNIRIQINEPEVISMNFNFIFT